MGCGSKQNVLVLMTLRYLQDKEPKNSGKFLVHNNEIWKLSKWLILVRQHQQTKKRETWRKHLSSGKRMVYKPFFSIMAKLTIFDIFMIAKRDWQKYSNQMVKAIIFKECAFLDFLIFNYCKQQNLPAQQYEKIVISERMVFCYNRKQGFI